MCLLMIACGAVPPYTLAVAANRDESYERPAAPAAFWHDAPDLLAGRDLEAGGTWLGVTSDGRFAALTNFREPGQHRPDAPSRGALVEGFLRSRTSAPRYTESLAKTASSYNGFTLLVWDGKTLACVSNRGRRHGALPPGIYGLSNGTLDEGWPKVNRAKAAFSRLLAHPPATLREDLFALLADREPAPDEALPSTGLPLAWERALSPVFVTTDRHGTRCSTVLLVRTTGAAEMEERTFLRRGEPAGRVRLSFTLSKP